MPADVHVTGLRETGRACTSASQARRRLGSAEADRTQLLRFFGYLDRTNRIPDGQLLDITLMIRSDLGDLASEYASWL